jgi:hypothetical protein
MLHPVTTRHNRVMLTRDPVSEPFDNAARKILEKAYANRGTWQQVWLPDPTIRQRTRFAGLGIDVGGPDPLPAGGGTDARTRWGRGFIRALYYQHKWYSGTAPGTWTRRTSPRHAGGLRVEVGRHVAASPQFDPANPAAGGLPPRRRIRVQLAAGGKAKDAAVARLSDADRIYTRSGQPAARWSGGGKFRDWG